MFSLTVTTIVVAAFAGFVAAQEYHDVTVRFFTERLPLIPHAAFALLVIDPEPSPVLPFSR